MNAKLALFNLLLKIPTGKVTTYKILAEKVGLANPRLVGRIIHSNPNPAKYPCHRVVRSDGTIAEGYAFGGQKAQIKKLINEDVRVVNGRIKLDQYLLKKF